MIMVNFYLTDFAMLMSAKVQKHFSVMKKNLTHFLSQWVVKVAFKREHTGQGLFGLPSLSFIKQWRRWLRSKRTDLQNRLGV